MTIVCTMCKINQEQGVKIWKKSLLKGKECIMKIQAKIKAIE